MSRREAERLIRGCGAHVVELVDPRDEQVQFVVVSDELLARNRFVTESEAWSESLRASVARGEAEVIGESALWARLGLVESGEGVERLYTVAMLAELVGAPVAAIRQWHRSGALIATREVQRLAYFDFAEIGVARKLSQLLAAGCGLAAINRQLSELCNRMPGARRPLADPAVVVEGPCLYIRTEEGLAEPTGQRLIDFDTAEPGTAEDIEPAILSMAESVLKPFEPLAKRQATAAESLRTLAGELEGTGFSAEALETYRTVLLSGNATATDHFALAELLYMNGDLTAARERYYIAIEQDENLIEARSNLGCVLAELGEIELAEAAFRGALESHPEYADAHFHLARLLDQQERGVEAEVHWRSFLNLASYSPWANEARRRLNITHDEGGGQECGAGMRRGTNANRGTSR